MVNGGASENMGIRNKKGIFFTMLVLVMLSLFLVTYSFYSSFQERRTINERVSTMNKFISSLESDMSRQIYISGYRALLSLQSKITDSGQYVSDVDASLEEALLYGTIDGVEF